MPSINRDNIQDAEKLIEIFIPEDAARKQLLAFLADEINYAHSLNPGNWNLNLDKNGYFLRFNIGHEYCIQITSKSLLILCLKDDLKRSISDKDIELEFLGYYRKRKVISRNLEDIPDCLAKVPNSVGCIIHDYERIKSHLSFLKSPNRSFIKYAIVHTIMLPVMKQANSIGSIEYLEKFLNKKLPRPLYTFTRDAIEKYEEAQIKKAKKLTNSELEEIIKKVSVLQKSVVQITQYHRNIYVLEYAKRKANGICQDCQKMAPFKNKKTGEPYLEIHHIVPLSKGGKDCIDNVIALCPNCHRKRHYG